MTLLTDEDVQEQFIKREITGVWKPGKAYRITSAQNDQFPDTVRIRNQDVYACGMVCNVATLQLAFIPGVSQVKLAPGEEQILLGHGWNDTSWDWCARDDWQPAWGDYDERVFDGHKIDGRTVLTVVNTYDHVNVDRVKLRYRGRDFILEKDKVVECAAETFSGFDDSGC